MKKSVLMITGIVAALAVVAIALFGVQSFVLNQKVYVQEIIILNERDIEEENILLIDYNGGETTKIISWDIISSEEGEEPTDSEISIRSNNSEVTISDIDQEERTAVITFSAETGATITLEAIDRGQVTSEIRIMPTQPTETVNLFYNFANSEFAEPASDEEFLVIDDNLIFINGRDYFLGLTGSYDVDVVDGGSFIDLDGGNIETLGVGSFTLEISDGETSQQITIEIIDRLLEMGLSGGYESFVTRTTDVQNTIFKDKDGTYQVGSQNAFKTQLSLTNREYETIEEFEKEFELEILNEGVYEEVLDISTYMSETDDNKAYLEFTQVAEDNQFRLTIKSKYQDDKSVEMEFLVNDGVNVHNHEELQAAYEDDQNVFRINVHNDIEAVADPERHLYTEDAPLELRGQLINEFIGGSFGMTNSEHSDYGKTGNIYLRPATTDLEIVGNYQMIDGGDLPLVKNHTGDQVAVADGNHINVQSALFRFGYSRDRYDNGDANLTMSNLYMTGNSKRSEDTFDSGGVHLMYMSTMGEGHFENMKMDEAVVALFLNDATGYNYANNMTITETYNSAVFSWTGNLSITNSDLINNGGPSIIMVDASANTNSGSTISNDPVLDIDDYTINAIDNWVTGEEGWFQGLGVNTIMLQLKSQLEGVVNAQYSKTVIQDFGSYELVNFKILLMNQNPAEPGGNLQTQGQINVIKDEGVDEFHRSYNLVQSLGLNPAIYAGPMVEEYLDTMIAAQLAGGPQNLTPEEQAILSDYSNENLEIIIAEPSLIPAPVNIILEWMDSE